MNTANPPEELSIAVQVLRLMPYEEYLRSVHWSEARARCMKDAKNKCICGEWAWDAHHLSYENKGHEKKGDVIALCRKCHDRFHATWLHRAKAELEAL